MFRSNDLISRLEKAFTIQWAKECASIKVTASKGGKNHEESLSRLISYGGFNQN